VGGAFGGLGQTVGHLFPFPLPVFGGGFFMLGLLLGVSSDMAGLEDVAEEARGVIAQRGLGNAARIMVETFKRHFGANPHINFLRDPEDPSLDWLVLEAEVENAEGWLSFWGAALREVGLRAGGYFALSLICGGQMERGIGRTASEAYFEALRGVVDGLRRLLGTEPQPNRSLHFWARTTLEALGYGEAAGLLDDLRVARLVGDFHILENPHKRLACRAVFNTMAEKVTAFL